MKRRAVVWGVIGITAFVLVDIALFGFLFVRPHAVVAEGGSEPQPIIATPSATPMPTEPPLRLTPRARLLVAVDDRSAWRTTSAACGGTSVAQLEHTVDGGKTWTANPLEDAQYTSILAIATYDDANTVGVLAAKADCQTQFQLSYTGGQFWKGSPSDQPDDLVYPSSDSGALTSGNGRLVSPCTAVAAFAIRSATDSAFVCQDADLHLTFDGAATWQTVDVSAPVLAAAPTAAGYLLATLHGGGCGGIEIESVRMPDSLISSLSCLPQLEAAAGTVLAIGSNVVWLWSGDAVLLSADGGATWSAAS